MAPGEHELPKSDVPAAPSRLTDKDLANIKSTFRKWDLTGDGFISEQELSTVLSALGTNKKEIRLIFEAMDSNRDGKIDYDEFCRWLGGEHAKQDVLAIVLAPNYEVAVSSIIITLDAEFLDVKPFLRIRDAAADKVLLESSVGEPQLHVVRPRGGGGERSGHTVTEVTIPKGKGRFDIPGSGGKQAVVLEVCGSRMLFGSYVVGRGELYLCQAARALSSAIGSGRVKISNIATEVDVCIDDPANPGKTVNSKVKQIVGQVSMDIAEGKVGDPAWASLRVETWTQDNFLPRSSNLKETCYIMKNLAVRRHPKFELLVAELAQRQAIDALVPFLTWSPETARQELEKIALQLWSLQRSLLLNNDPDTVDSTTLGALCSARRTVAQRVLADSIREVKGLAQDHRMMTAALQFAVMLDARCDEFLEVESALKRYLRFPEETPLEVLLNRSEVDKQSMNASEHGLKLEYNKEGMPIIHDGLRFQVRDATVARVLGLLGSTSKRTYSQDLLFEFSAMETCLRPTFQMPPSVAALLTRVKLFLGSCPARCLTIPGTIAARKRDWNALIGRYDVVAVPSLVEYDEHFKHIKRNGFFGETGPGGSGWFWTLHAAAVNIGETPMAEDFEEYSMAADDGIGRWLNEEKYIASMGLLWRQCLRVASHLNIEDFIVFPFGMGAFLRKLRLLDRRYADHVMIRRLRYRVAAGFFEAAADISLAVDPPMRLHICLPDSEGESRVNHNVFVEAAAAKIKAVPALQPLLNFHRNRDALELANTLASDGQPDQPGKLLRRKEVDDEIRKVGLLNGANNKLLGNHWFSDGALSAIDENLHRRSSALCVAALLLNAATKPQLRSYQELAANVARFGGETVEFLVEPPVIDAAPSRVSSKVASSRASSKVA